MAEFLHREVVGNTAQGRGNTMFNAEAELRRRVVEGNSATGGSATGGSATGTGGSVSIIQHQHFHGTSAGALKSARRNQDEAPNYGTASLSQLGGSDSIEWEQRTVRSCNEIRKLIESIESMHIEIRQDFDTLGDRNAGLTEFKDYQILFDLTVDDLQLMGRIEEMFREKWTPIAPPASIIEVEEITSRLREILRTLTGARPAFPSGNSIAGPAVKSKTRRMRAQKTTPASGSKFFSSSGVRKRGSKPRLKHQESKLGQPRKGFERLRGKMKLLRKLAKALQGILIGLKPPSVDRSPKPDALSTIELPQELKVARFAAGMLYKSLGNLCPNPDHASHNVLFRLDTTEAVFPVERKGEFRLRVAFEGSSNCPTWFDINSVVQLREAALDEDNDDMDLDVAVVSASADGNGPFDFPDRRQQDVHPRPSISSSRSQRFAGEHTARFCLYNHRQQVRSASLVAAELRYSDACTHVFYYPATEEARNLDEEHRISSLHESLRGRRRLEPRQKIRLARIISESLLKFDPSDWLRCDLDTNNILVYTVKDNLEPHLRIRLQSTTDCLAPGFGKIASRVLEQLSKIMCEIAIGPKKASKMATELDRLHEVVEEELNKGYASVVKHCRLLAGECWRGIATDKILMDRFYGEVVSSLRELEGRICDTP
ncbi:hypothetical protein diail_11670 [Diaporthe ilicicola]|nr:hypothetical protein diail_11670 [Diaporthe ilicicola]